MPSTHAEELLLQTDLIVLAAALGAACFAACDRRWAWAAVSAFLAAGTAWLFAYHAQLAPVTLGPQAPWLGLSAAVVGAFGCPRPAARSWPTIAAGTLFLPVWAGSGALGVLILGVALWRFSRSDSSAEGLSSWQTGGMLLLQSTLVMAPQVADLTEPAGWRVVWAAALLGAWALTTLPVPAAGHLRRAVAAIACAAVIATAAACGPLTITAAALAAFIVLEACARTAPPGWWFFGAGGLVYVGFDVAATFFELLMPLALVALCSGLLRIPPPTGSRGGSAAFGETPGPSS